MLALVLFPLAALGGAAFLVRVTLDVLAALPRDNSDFVFV